MLPASVGFQCPECVHAGAKQTRQGSTPYGGGRSANPMLTSWVLIGINVSVWLLIMATGQGRSEWVTRLSLIGKGLCGGTNPGALWTNGDQPVATADACQAIAASGRDAIWVPGVADGAVWQLLTSAFTHVEIMHIAFNMLALWFLGPQLEMALGRLRFLGVYLGSAMVGSAAVYLLSDPSGYTLGASGAVFGLLGALLLIGYKVGGNIRPLLAWIGINVVITVTGARISWQGHLGGFIGGLLIAAVIIYAPRKRRGTWQAAGFTALMVVTGAVIALRTAALM